MKVRIVNHNSQLSSLDSEADKIEVTTKLGTFIIAENTYGGINIRQIEK